jgi:RNA polymerase sigma-70 factor (ECF subfamily)
MENQDLQATSAADERSLIARCRRGEARAWDELFDLHYHPAGRFVFQLIPSFSREDVEEVCQETFVAVIRNLDGFHGRCRLQTWIFRIAANKARDHQERRAAAKRGGGQMPLSLDAADPETGLTLDPPASGAGPDTRLEQAETFKQLRQALDQLGGACREIIELRYFADLSYEEIGSSLKLNLKTVSSRLSKCLDKLEHVVRGLEAREPSTPFPVQPSV